MTFVINAGIHGLNNTNPGFGVRNPLYHHDTFSPSEFDDQWTDQGVNIVLHGTTSISYKQNGSKISFSVALSGADIYEQVLDPVTGEYHHEMLGTATFPTFQFSDYTTGSIDRFTLYIFDAFADFMSKQDLVFNGSDVADSFNASNTYDGPNRTVTIYGGAGDDAFYGASQCDNTIYAGDDDDFVTITTNDSHNPSNAPVVNFVSGDAGDDDIEVADRVGDSANVQGGLGNDTLYDLNGEGQHTLDGGAGNDDIDGVTGDTLIGGTGDDYFNCLGGTVYYAGSFYDYTITIETGGGIDPRTVIVGEGTDTLFGADKASFSDGVYIVGPDIFVPTGTPYPIIGTIYNDTISPTKAPHGQPHPGNGGDVLYGLAGNDVLDGGGGGDSMHGGAGNDTYTVNFAGDKAIETDRDGHDEGGRDTVLSSVSYALGAFVEDLTLTEHAGISGIGNTLGNKITGNDQNNSLDGMAGRDVLTGNDGDDGLDGGEDNDKLSGGNGDDVITGGTGKDKLDGGAGADNLVGGSGADVLKGGADADMFTLAPDDGTGADKVADFDAASGDKIALYAKDFDLSAGHGLDSGGLDPDWLEVVSGRKAEATRAHPEFLYNTSNHALMFDADGAGGEKALTIATFTDVASLSTSDFLIL